MSGKAIRVSHDWTDDDIESLAEAWKEKFDSGLIVVRGDFEVFHEE